MKYITLFLIFTGISYACQEPCQGKVDFSKVREYLIGQFPDQMALDQSDLAFVGAYGIHEDIEELRGYGFFPKTKMAGIYRLDCNHQEDFSFQSVEMVSVLPEMKDKLSVALRDHYLWQLGYPEILNLWVSKLKIQGLSQDFDHWLVLVNLPDQGSRPSWWKFSEFRSKKESLKLVEWTGAFAYPVNP